MKVQMTLPQSLNPDITEHPPPSQKQQTNKQKNNKYTNKTNKPQPILPAPVWLYLCYFSVWLS